MNEQRLKGLMGLCVRAGQGIFGEEGCLKALRSGQAGLLLTEEGLAKGPAERYEQVCRRESIPCFTLPEGLLEEATGRPGRAMAVRAGGFAQQIRACLEPEAGEAGEGKTDGTARAK